MDRFVGIDIGSTCAKAVVIDNESNISIKLLRPTGWSSIDTAKLIYSDLTEFGIDMKNALVVATGYGRGAEKRLFTC